LAGVVERAGLVSYDSLYVSVSDSDAALSCPGRMLAERAPGATTLVVCLGERPAARTSEAQELEAAYALLGVDLLFLSQESLEGEPLSASLRAPGAEAQDLARVLEEVRQKTQPRHVYLPLGVGGLLSHRIAHETALRVFSVVGSCDVFFYEERPLAFIAGATRLRLAQIGASLPPGAWEVKGAPLLSTLWGLQRAPHLARRFTNWGERASSAVAIFRQWTVSRTWRPQKAFGPRLQPVLQEVTDSARQVPFTFASRFSSLFGSRRRFESALRTYSRSLGRVDAMERYWLVLPERPMAGAAFAPLGESVEVQG
jgi:hypothetical protein